MSAQSPPWNILRDIGDVSNEGLVLYNASEMRIVYANQSAIRLLGIREGASLAEVEDMLSRVLPEDRDYVKNQLSKLVSHPAIPEFEFRITTDAGSLVYLCCNGYFFSEQSFLTLFLRDITASKTWSNYLVEFGGRKNTLLDTLAHNLSGALNLTQHLSSEAEKGLKGADPESVSRYLQLVRENSEHSLKIIKDLWQHEHGTSPNISVRKSRVNIVEKLSFMYDELQKSYGQRRFNFETTSDSIYLHADEIKLLQVANNFTSNAIKFSHSDEPITIRVSESPEEVVVSVKDQGIGIPDDLKPLIFERLPRKGRTGLNGEKSVGLGLWICKNLVELMNGRIWFESEEENGSVFYFSLPKGGED